MFGQDRAISMEISLSSDAQIDVTSESGYLLAKFGYEPERCDMCLKKCDIGGDD